MHFINASSFAARHPWGALAAGAATTTAAPTSSSRNGTSGRPRIALAGQRDDRC